MPNRLEEDSVFVSNFERPSGTEEGIGSEPNRLWQDMVGDGATWRACTPVDDARRRNMFPATTAADKTANDGMLESLREKMNAKKAGRCITTWGLGWCDWI